MIFMLLRADEIYTGYTFLCYVLVLTDGFLSGFPLLHSVSWPSC